MLPVDYSLFFGSWDNKKENEFELIVYPNSRINQELVLEWSWNDQFYPFLFRQKWLSVAKVKARSEATPKNWGFHAYAQYYNRFTINA